MVAGRWDICKQARMFHEVVSRDRGEGFATLSAGACAACRATAGDWIRGVPNPNIADPHRPKSLCSRDSTPSAALLASARIITYGSVRFDLSEAVRSHI
jgi:hypothetical protein